ncbi:MAG: hypothetical protein ACOYL6_09270 [Bacteriovoracaceae bacterium]
MNLKSSYSPFFLFLLILGSCAGKPVTINSEDDKIIDDYLALHTEFVKQTCTPKDLETHQNFLKEYRGTGYYIPELGDNHLDVASLEAILPLYDEKILWLTEEKENLKKKKSLPEISAQKKKINDLIEKLLKLKYDHYYEIAKSKKADLSAAAHVLHNDLYKEVAELIYQLPWLKSFKFPVDHLYNRNKYDTLKSAPAQVAKANKKHRSKIQANYIYLLRKMLEDGAQDPDHTKSDTFLRAAIDTLYLTLKEEKDFLSENSRYDLDYVLSQIEKQVARGKGAQLDRINEWLERTKNAKEFYQKLIAGEKEKPKAGGDPEAEKILKELSVDRFNLSNFTMKKQVEVYKFWSKQNELLKSLWVLESILYSEVGSVDGREALERRDVAQVVYNRYSDKYYKKLPHKNTLYTYLNKELTDEEIQKEAWLNVLFKEGEFSFTYYFIPSSHKVFCPDVSRTGKFLQKENLKIALNTLRHPNMDFRATRYFSRASMTGRIDMSTVWKDFIRLPESRGMALTETSRLLSFYKQNKLEILYSFSDLDKVDHDVLKIQGEMVVIKHSERENPTLYSWRNPHNFIYFKKD